MSKQDVVFLVLVVGLWFLWRIAEHLKAIRTTLEVIAEKTSVTAYSTSTSLDSSLNSLRFTAEKTKTLLERAVKKQWGSAINLE
jgi:hypothetical protein